MHWWLKRSTSLQLPADSKPSLTIHEPPTQTTLGSLTTSGSTPDPEMNAAWPAGCFGSTVGTGNNQYWDNWKSFIFYQVNAQYSPSITPPLASPISINGTGNYRAAVIASRGVVPGGAARDLSFASTYLEGINAAPAVLAPDFIYFSPSNPAYSGNNDLVLCVDGNINCQ